MKLRDLLAVPFWRASHFLERIALAIGGVWTAEMFMEGWRKQDEIITKTDEQAEV